MLTHRFISDLRNLEQERTYLGQPVQGLYRYLIIGTFNPDNNSCVKQNNAQWFYGRNQSKFWKYVPIGMHNGSLHPTDNPGIQPQIWKNYCVNNRIIIIDLVKSIDSPNPLPDFGDDIVDVSINNNLSNVEYFHIHQAFHGVTFDKVIYSLLWTANVQRLKDIRDRVNNDLITAGCINNRNQIFYCPTPSRNDAQPSWSAAL